MALSFHQCVALRFFILLQQRARSIPVFQLILLFTCRFDEDRFFVFPTKKTAMFSLLSSTIPLSNALPPLFLVFVQSGKKSFP